MRTLDELLQAKTRQINAQLERDQIASPEELLRARTIRTSEREQYLAANPRPDAPRRWRLYEASILAKYGSVPVNAHAYHHQRALDLAWRNRDRHHREKHMQETRLPTSDHTYDP